MSRGFAQQYPIIAVGGKGGVVQLNDVRLPFERQLLRW